MRGTTSVWVKIAAGVAICAAAVPFPAAARVHHHRLHHQRLHHHHYWNDRPLTVTRHVHRAPVATADPFHGPAAIITGPNAIAATIVSLPFRAVNTVFSPYGNPATNPLVLVGAPVYAAAHVAELPFFVVGSAFGAPPNIVY